MSRGIIKSFALDRVTFTEKLFITLIFLFLLIAVKKGIMTNLNLPKLQVVLGSATPWKRFVAFFVDMLIVEYLILGPFTRLLSRISALMPQSSNFYSAYGAAYSFFESNSSVATGVYLMFFIMALFVISYFALLEWAIGQSVGKMIFNLYVISDYYNNRGRRHELRFWQCIVRNLRFLPLAPVILLWISAPFLIVLGPRKRALEFLSKTRVVEPHTMGYSIPR
ncbi:hypothetical protein COT48_03780 [Candidatus Woesearchaeota archaeon CG08_land_8_20_14_0_20_47_9]|nr:MAG: hypothetical protein AUJ69_00090 [Candidatus Woesearchaeota archaeon CG1_02_47_18]PIN71986.1 MAG: hypothetical protein COV22_04350 [Candidatus Woesearchaeota archaeon CG10_big_fil_rev_8_21_14_0_10_47_5]PIO03713.1 MAG: hypothetical protein COT48_03780 [Candidatus Woesearchaeota archaeon CG08_land_8_20_14_0_20_47_9]